MLQNPPRHSRDGAVRRPASGWPIVPATVNMPPEIGVVAPPPSMVYQSMAMVWAVVVAIGTRRNEAENRRWVILALRAFITDSPGGGQRMAMRRRYLGERIGAGAPC